MHILVSILMPACNAEKSISYAVNSCLLQTYAHLEILVLDDASADNTVAILQTFKDDRIRIIHHPENMGVAASRNKLLEEARGEYIAWLDADDTMLPDRIDKQLAYMLANPGIDIAGSWVFTELPGLPQKKLPLLHSQVKTMLWFRNCIIQPSIMSKNFYKRENIWYDTTYANAAEDYELWYRLSKTKHFANIPECLTRYKALDGEALEAKNRKTGLYHQLERIWEQKWKDAGINTDERDKKIFQEFVYRNDKLGLIEGSSILSTLNKLRQIHRDDFFGLVVSYHKLRLWRNISLTGKLKYCLLALNLFSIVRMRQHYLLQ